MDDEREVTEAPVASRSVTKRYITNEATKFEFIGPGTVQIAQGPTTALTLTVPTSEQEHIEVKLDGDRLKVSHKGGLIRHREPNGPLQYELTVPILAELKLSHGLTGEAANIDNRDVSIELKGGSILAMLQLRAAELDAKVADGSRLSASGAVGKQKIKLSDGAICQNGELSSNEAEIEAAGGSEATVRASKSLKVKASGGSTVTYGGDKVDLDVQTSDGSELLRLGR